jgi:hypothetical protein
MKHTFTICLTALLICCTNRLVDVMIENARMETQLRLQLARSLGTLRQPTVEVPTTRPNGISL